VIFKFNSKKKEFTKMEKLYFEAVLTHKHFRNGNAKILVEAVSPEAALAAIREREGKDEVNGVWIPKGCKVIGIGLTGHTGLLTTSNLTIPTPK
jgi:hypothetical protein